MTHIRYIDRTRKYYAALGYDTPYRWAGFKDVPFAALKQPLALSTIAIVTTAAPFQPGKGEQGPGAPYNAGAKFYTVYAGETASMPDLRISHVAIDRDHTAADDIATYFPLTALKQAATEGRVGRVADQFYGLPTNRSHATTMQKDCPELLRLCRLNGVDAVILVPNCPVCHQSVSLAARTLEVNGIPTVIMGCARDIVEHVGVPRFVFSDFPLGNAAGRPHDPASQHQTLNLALDMLETATGPRTTRMSPLIWPGPADWKSSYSNPDLLSAEDIAQRRAAFDAGKIEAKQLQDNKKI